jgi:hypothetical protein
MTKLSYRDLLRWASHPSEEELLSYLDQQLRARKAGCIRRHLEGCWRCRGKQEEIERSISGIVKNLNGLLGDSAGYPAQAQPRFEDRLRRLALQTEPLPPFLNLFASLSRSRIPIQLVTSLLFGLVVVLWFLSFGSSPPLSAKEVLHQAEQASRVRFQNVVAPVVYQKLKIRRQNAALRREEAVSWEIWRDLDNSRSRERVLDNKGLRFIEASLNSWSADGHGLDPVPQSQQETGAFPGPVSLGSPDLPSILTELDQVFQANHMNRLDPLSAASYVSWQRSVSPKSEEVIETFLPDGQKSLTLRNAAAGPFKENAVVRAELVVRAEDWHPVAQRLEVQGEQGMRNYELIEMDYTVLASNSLPTSIFSDLPEQPLPITSAPVPSPVINPTTAESLASEVEAKFALHRVRACIGRPISVVRGESGRIEVRGIVETKARKTELDWALKGIPWVSLKVQTMEEEALPAEALHAASSEAEGATTVVPLGAESQTVKGLGIQDLLEQYFRRAGGPTARVPEQIASLSRDAVSLSEGALEEVWALRRLAEGSLSINPEELRMSSRRLLETMVRDHESALKAHAQQSRALLKPVLTVLLVNQPGSVAGEADGTEDRLNSKNPDWIAASLQLFETVDRMVRLTLGLFADTRLPFDSREAAIRDLLSVFDRVEVELDLLEAQTARAFAEQSDSLALQERKE